jgi:hypothetical protein
MVGELTISQHWQEVGLGSGLPSELPGLCLWSADELNDDVVELPALHHCHKIGLLSKCLGRLMPDAG